MKLLLILYRTTRDIYFMLAAKYIRWKLAVSQNIHVPASTYIGPGCQISGVGFQVSIGENTTLVANVISNGPLSIGNNVIIAANCTLISRNHDFHKGDALPYGTAYAYKPIVIQDNVWIGSNVSIIPGVCIGEGAVIGLGSVVTHDVPPCAVVGGNPARVIRERDKKHYERLLTEEKFLNNIRGSFLGLAKYINDNEEGFEKNLSENGFMLSSEIVGVDPEYRSHILYNLHLKNGATRYGNAGAYHIAIKPSTVVDLRQSARDVVNSMALVPVQAGMEEIVFQDLVELLEQYGSA